MLRRMTVFLLATMAFACTANAAKSPIKLHSSAAFNQQAPTMSPYTPSSSNSNCPSTTPSNNNTATPTPPPYVPYYYTPSTNAPNTPATTNPSTTSAAAPIGNGSILLNAPSPDNQKENTGWTIT